MLRALGLPEIMTICAVALLLFGGKRFAELGKGFGQSLKEFKKAHSEFKDAEKELKS